MIRIVRGPGAALEPVCVRLASEAAEPVWLAPPESPRSWNGVRNLLAGTARSRGRDAVETVLQRHRPAAGRLLPRFAAVLSPDERTAAHLMTACAESHLSHNLLVQRPLFEGWAALLAELTAGRTLVVPDVARLDRESLGALRTLYRRFPEQAPDLILGLDPHRPSPPPDDRGVIWEIPVADGLKLALGLLALPRATLVEVDAGQAGDGRGPQDLDPSPWEDPDETAGWELVTDGKAPPEPSRAEAGVRAVQATFRRFAFTATLRLGLGLLATRASLSRSQAAEVHALVALAAHNRQFRSLGNRPLARLVERHLLAAWKDETRPARRSALAYRLAVTVGRRLKKPEQGLEWAGHAIDEAQREGIATRQAAHLEAWGRNIRAYAWMESRQLDKARTECEHAFALADSQVREGAGSAEKAAVAADPLLREIAFTHALLADNLAALAELAGDDDGFRHWKGIGESPAAGVPGLVRFEGLSWVRFHRREGRLDRALPRAMAALESARAEQDALREYRYAVQVGDLLDRLGRHDEALERFEEAGALRRRLGNPRFLRPVTGAAASVARRAGRLDEARTLLREALAEAEGAARAEGLAALGRIAAEAGDTEEAQARIGQAIDAAVELGERDVLVRVAVAAAEASLELDRRDEAREAFGRAGEMAEAETPAADRLAVGLGLAETAEESLSTESLRDLLVLLPEALDDADTWERLPRLASVVEQTGGAGNPDLEELLDPLRIAIEQRGG